MAPGPSYALIPLESSHKVKILARLDQTIRAVVKGVVLTALVQARRRHYMLRAPFPLVLADLLSAGAATSRRDGPGVGAVAVYLFWMGPIGKGI
ncbi:MAG: hypothetical protein U0361_09775 [Nitrospiraceae bacterium]